MFAFDKCVTAMNEALEASRQFRLTILGAFERRDLSKLGRAKRYAYDVRARNPQMLVARLEP